MISLLHLTLPLNIVTVLQWPMCSILGADHNDLWDEQVRQTELWAVNNSHVPSPQPLILTLAQFQDVLFTAIGMRRIRQTFFRSRRFHFAASLFVSSVH